ncbi:MAG: transporter suffix domain-containing protein [Bacteroidetes bacterium]|nr:transporter suffix domain-containing protein [Bacteroidota bacterium]
MKNWKIRLGISLIILSALSFLSLLIIPFLKSGSGIKVTISTVLIVLGEVTFWTGGFLLGKEILSKYKSYLNPANWFKKKLDKQELES